MKVKWHGFKAKWGMWYGLRQAGGQEQRMDLTRGDCATTKNLHLRSSTVRLICCTLALLELVIMAAGHSLFTGIHRAPFKPPDIIVTMYLECST